MTETGETRDGLPVYARHPEADRIARALTRGFTGRWLRLYAREQQYLARAGKGRAEPAYLLLSSRQGGFARVGFWLGAEEKRQAGYVDIYRTHPLAGRFGAVDQILPHELAHVIVEQLAGPVPPGPSTQIHALGVRTDPVTAFNEGLAESVQVLAIDDPDADPATRALAGDARQQELAERQTREYARELVAWWRPGARRRLAFPFWYSGAEQVLRYHAVKDNRFAHEPSLPDRLLSPSRLYDAYLFSSTQPGLAAAPFKPAGVLLSTEAVVSHLFLRWATDAEIGGRYRDGTFYARFGTAAGQVTPLENAYLKLFHVLAVRRPTDTTTLVRAYQVVFPDEAPAVTRVVRAALGGQDLPDAPAIWLANVDFKTGTSLFDQFRATPRVHTFDLNAATLVDLLGVPGIDRPLARAILARAPFRSPGDLVRVPGMNPAVVDRVAGMSRAMASLAAAQDEGIFSQGLFALLRPYLVRALVVLCAAAAFGAFAYHRVRRARRLAAIVNATLASFVVLAVGWVIEGVPLVALPLVPAVCLGGPGALWWLAWRRDARTAARLLAAWVVAALPAVVLLQPWG